VTTHQVGPNGGKRNESKKTFVGPEKSHSRKGKREEKVKGKKKKLNQRLK